METWLRCKVTPGQFSNEYAVQGERFDGRGFSLFAWERDVDTDFTTSKDVPAGAWLRVEVLDQSNDKVLVRLPSPCFENGDTVSVQAAQLKVSPSPQRA